MDTARSSRANRSYRPGAMMVVFVATLGQVHLSRVGEEIVRADGGLSLSASLELYASAGVPLASE